MRFEQQISACLRLAAAGLLIGFVFGSGREVFASEQTPGQVAPPATAPTPTQSGPTISIGQDEAVRMALENNLGIQSERLNPQIQTLGVARALSAYGFQLFANSSRNSTTAPPSDFLSQGVAVTSSTDFSSSGGISQNLPWGGGNYSVGLGGRRYTSDAPRTPFSPQLSSGLEATVSQPLLRGFTMDANKQALLLSRNQQSVADIQLSERVTLTSRGVRHAYFNLVAALAGLQVAQQSLDLARQSLRNNERRVEVGTMAPIDIVEAQAEVARQEETVILQQGNIQAAEDALRTLILNPTQNDFWSARLEPSEQPVLTPQPIDVDAAIRNALATRTDIAQLRKQIESTDIAIRFNQNQKLPAIDVEARYRATGLGGTQFRYETSPIEGEPPARFVAGQRSFRDVLSDVFANDFKNWTVAVQVSYPLGTSNADAALAQNRLQRQQSQVSLRELETEVTRQVREVGRQVSTTLQRVEATRKARELAERRLEAEEKRLAVGLSDTFRLFQAQRDLASAKQSELNAVIAYNRALVDFEAVQTVPIR